MSSLVPSIGSTSRATTKPDTVSLAGLNKADVLAALYNGSKPLGMGFLAFKAADMSRAEVQRMLDGGQTYFDYVQGRVMKVDLSGDELNTWGYNRDNGVGAAERIIGKLRNPETTPAKTQTTLPPSPSKLTVSPQSPSQATITQVLAPKSSSEKVEEKSAQNDNTVKLENGSTVSIGAFDKVYFNEATVSKLEGMGIPYPDEWFMVTKLGPQITAVGSMGGRFTFDSNAGIVKSVSKM